MGNNGSNDCENYVNGYPGLKDGNTTVNKDFYFNQLKSQPSGDFIDNIHKNWFGNYDLLEDHHGYIQWIFPIREHGVNGQAEPLTLVEAEQIKNDEKAKERVKKSYDLMLDFYGFKISNVETGALERTENYAGRFRNVCTHSHNWLRITRILKSLGELGYEHYKLPLLRMFAKEIYITKELERCKSSFEGYWSKVLRNKQDQEKMEIIKVNYRNGSETEEKMLFPVENKEDELDAVVKRHKVDHEDDDSSENNSNSGNEEEGSSEEKK